MEQKSERSHWRFRLGVCLLLALVILFGLWFFYGSPWYTPPVVISRQTTYVTEPLLAEDGLPDYLAAINRRYSQGVTPENNAAVVWWQALGREPDGFPIPPEVFQQLGMKPPVQKQGFDSSIKQVVSFTGWGEEGEYLDKVNKLWLRLYRCPWRSEDFPVYSRLLDRNRKWLDLCVQGSRRTRFFSPAFTNTPRARVVGASLMPSREVRDMGRDLGIRAMRHLGHGRVQAAWQDIYAQKRTGRLLQQHWDVSGLLHAYALENRACDSLNTLLARYRPGEKEALAWLEQWDRLPPPQPMGERIDFSYRLLTLSLILAHSQGLPVMDDPNDPPSWSEKFLTQMDPNLATRICNQLFDQARPLMELPPSQKRCDQVERLLSSWQTQGNARRQWAFWFPLSRRARTQYAAWELTTGMLSSAQILLVAELRARQRHLLGRVALALAVYRARHGEYPQKLEALVPELLGELPQDLFVGKPLSYRRTEQGYLLYSVGPSGKDHGGRDGDPDFPDNEGDDVVFRVPPRWLEKPLPPELPLPPGARLLQKTQSPEESQR